MKRHKKLITLLIALCFVFSLVPMAAASTPAPAARETGHPAWPATQRLNALGIIEGYPDGTFGLGRDITRAEFAKVAVMTAGFGTGADLLRATPSRFTDVRTDVWYTGWINMADARGLIKGDPAGTFRPNDRINNAEVITVLLRILGYDDRLPGPWPLDYLVEATRLEVTRDLTLDARAHALRGNVFRLTDNVLNENVVVWNRDIERFEDRNFAVAGAPVENRTLLRTTFRGEVLSDRLITGVEFRADGTLARIFTKDGTTGRVERRAGVDGFEVHRDVVISAGTAWDLIDKYADLKIVTKRVAGVETTAVQTIVVRPTTVVTATAIDLLPGNRIRVGATEYEAVTVAGTVYGYANFSRTGELFTQTFPATGSTRVSAVDRFDLIIDRNNRVEMIRRWDYSGIAPIVVRDTILDRAPRLIRQVSGTGSEISIAEGESVMVIRNGVPATLAAIRPGDLVFNLSAAATWGVTYLLQVLDRTATGVLTAAATTHIDDRPRDLTLTVGGTGFGVARHPAMRVSNDAGATFTSIVAPVGTGLTGYIGQSVTVRLDPFGRVAALVSAHAAVGDIMAMVRTQPTAIIPTVVGNVYQTEVVRTDGTRVNLLVRTADTTPAAAVWGAAPGTIVRYALDAEGYIRTFAAVALAADAAAATATNLSAMETLTAANIDRDRNRIFVAGSWRFIGDATIIMAAHRSVPGPVDPAVTTRSVLLATPGAPPADVRVFPANSLAPTHVFVVNAAALATPVTAGLVVARGVDADGLTLTLNLGAETRTFQVPAAVTGTVYHGANTGDAGATVAQFVYLGRGDLVTYTLDARGRMATVTERVYNGHGTVSALNTAGMFFVVGGVQVYYNADTRFWEVPVTGAPTAVTAAALANGITVQWFQRSGSPAGLADHIKIIR
jgi:hypothetical protein